MLIFLISQGCLNTFVVQHFSLTTMKERYISFQIIIASLTTQLLMVVYQQDLI